MSAHFIEGTASKALNGARAAKARTQGFCPVAKIIKWSDEVKHIYKLHFCEAVCDKKWYWKFRVPKGLEM